jgi:hypothetical protein
MLHLCNYRTFSGEIMQFQPALKHFSLFEDDQELLSESEYDLQ